MGIPISSLSRDQVKLYGTEDNTYEDFPLGSHVKIICLSQDHHFFFGETGTVIKNEGTYLSIIVEYDEPRHYKDGTIEKTFNFQPADLVIWNKASKIISEEQKRLNKLGKEEKEQDVENKQRSERFDMMDL
jgi:ribosomal protein L21E